MCVCVCVRAYLYIVYLLINAKKYFYVPDVTELNVFSYTYRSFLLNHVHNFW